jgi:hypothetical protein
MSAQWSPCGCPMVLSASGAMVPRCESVDDDVTPGACARRKPRRERRPATREPRAAVNQKRSNVTPAPDAETFGAGLSRWEGDNVA